MTDLASFPRPNVAVDVAVLTLKAMQLHALVLERADDPAGMALPGRFVRQGESVVDALSAALRTKAAVDVGERRPELVGVFDAPGRDPRGWTVSLGHAVVLPTRQVQGRTVPVGELPELLFDHAAIVEEAVRRVRLRYELRPDPDGILTDPFTLAELREVHQAVLGEPLQRDSFRRRMEPLLLPHVQGGRQTSRSSGGRPARTWTVAGVDETPRHVRLPRLESR
ncbi:MAG: NUDIX hydrolase [Microbacterium sp.]|nr:MAG: NUDIX hydrolase [Microbacterium sp.]